MIRLIIAGSREFKNYRLLEIKTDLFLKSINPGYKASDIEIVSGNARGADSLGEAYAKRKGFNIKGFPPDNENYNFRIAPLIRNQEMANYATHCIIFWDGQSPGSMDMLRNAKLRGLHTILYNESLNTTDEYNQP